MVKTNHICGGRSAAAIPVYAEAQIGHSQVMLVVFDLGISYLDQRLGHVGLAQ